MAGRCVVAASTQWPLQWPNQLVPPLCSLCHCTSGHCTWASMVDCIGTCCGGGQQLLSVGTELRGATWKPRKLLAGVPCTLAVSLTTATHYFYHYCCCPLPTAKLAKHQPHPPTASFRYGACPLASVQAPGDQSDVLGAASCSRQTGRQGQEAAEAAAPLVSHAMARPWCRHFTWRERGQGKSVKAHANTVVGHSNQSF